MRFLFVCGALWPPPPIASSSTNQISLLFRLYLHNFQYGFLNKRSLSCLRPPVLHPSAASPSLKASPVCSSAAETTAGSWLKTSGSEVIELQCNGVLYVTWSGVKLGKKDKGGRGQRKQGRQRSADMKKTNHRRFLLPRLWTRDPQPSADPLNALNVGACVWIWGPWGVFRGSKMVWWKFRGRVNMSCNKYSICAVFTICATREEERLQNSIKEVWSHQMEEFIKKCVISSFILTFLSWKTIKQ